jgi:hypothetical protein
MPVRQVLSQVQVDAAREPGRANHANRHESPGAVGAGCTVGRLAAVLPAPSGTVISRHGRYTKEVAAMRHWLREATELIRKTR